MALQVQNKSQAGRRTLPGLCALAATCGAGMLLVVLAGCNANPGGADSTSKNSSLPVLAIGANADADSQQAKTSDGSTNAAAQWAIIFTGFIR